MSNIILYCVDINIITDFVFPKKQTFIYFISTPTINSSEYKSLKALSRYNYQSGYQISYASIYHTNNAKESHMIYIYFLNFFCRWTSKILYDLTSRG